VLPSVSIERRIVIFGAHVIMYSRDADADREFFRDVLSFRSVDAGDEWLIFALPPTELAVHPTEVGGGHEVYLMCDDLGAEIAKLGEKGVQCSSVEEARWGLVTTIRLPGGGEIGLYEPRHPVAIER
jgi:catechol 2,3-dioxygenase-like lactoylglutathione lyase family enzyme